MSTAILFDTLEYSKKARAQGFTETQAEFQAEEMAKPARSIDDHLSTKQDLRELEERLIYKLTLRLGGLMITGVTVLGILMTILHR